MMYLRFQTLCIRYLNKDAYDLTFFSNTKSVWECVFKATLEGLK